jgi:hypothetical protein
MMLQPNENTFNTTRKSSYRCYNIGMSFFVSHESGTGNTTGLNGTDYRLVNEFFNRGHEIASHSVT